MCACGTACGGGCEFFSTTAASLKCSLAASLAGVADCARNIGVGLGLRPYTVHLVWTRWSGGERHVGQEEVVRQVQILPTPKVTAISDIQAALIAPGTDEQGMVRVSEVSVSGRYNEDLLLGRGTHGADTAPDQNFYWEVRYPQDDGTSIFRRFVPRGAPERDMERLEWKLDLNRAGEDRDRLTGVPQG